MSAFVTLGNAARKLAGDDASEIGLWLSLLEAQADDLHAVKTWTDHRHSAPGGISYFRSAEQWRLPIVAFETWCRNSGYALPQTDSSAPAVTPANPSVSSRVKQSRRAPQVAHILEVLRAQRFDAQRIPDGGKQKIKAECLTRPDLFTVAIFDRAWSDAVKAGHLRMEKHHLYAPR